MEKFSFYWCTNLKSIYFNGSKEQWEKVVADNTSIVPNTTFIYTVEETIYPDALIEIQLEDGNYVLFNYALGVLNYNGNTAIEIKIPSEFDGVDVREISGYSFYGCKQLTSVTLPKTIQIIGQGVFDYCPLLTDIYFEGTQDQWESIEKYLTEGVLDNIEIHYMSIPDSIISSDSDENAIYDFSETLYERIFTQDELYTTEELKVVLTIEKVAEITADEEEKIEELLSTLEYESNVGLILDINFDKYVGETKTELVNVDEEITITIDVPEEMKVDNKKYVVIRLHNEIADVLEDLDTNPDTITFKTDKFSTYVVASTDVEDFRQGDINNDNIIDNSDVTLLFQYVSKWDVEINESTADVNADNTIDNSDVTLLFQYVSKWDVELL